MKHYDILVLSGGFDPLHVGHVRMIQSARELAGLVVVGVNSDAWLVKNRGEAKMPFEERREIVSSAVGFDDQDDSANALLRLVKTMSPGARIAFGNGGSRTEGNVPEVGLCKELGIDLVWGLGGDRVGEGFELVRRPV